MGRKIITKSIRPIIRDTACILYFVNNPSEVQEVKLPVNGIIVCPTGFDNAYYFTCISDVTSSHFERANLKPVMTVHDMPVYKFNVGKSVGKVTNDDFKNFLKGLQLFPYFGNGVTA